MDARTIARLKKLAQATEQFSRKERLGWFAEQVLLDERFERADAAFIAFATPRRILWLIEQVENKQA